MSGRGRLVDITASVNNSPNPPTYPTGEVIEAIRTEGDENSPTCNPSPHFMMPTESSQAQQSGTTATSRPVTPASLKSSGTKRKASSFMTSAASKFLKPNSSKTSKSANGNMRFKSASPSPLNIARGQAAPSHIPIKRKPYLPPPQHTLPARLSPPPADKPLPSLPVATIVTKSPIHRRSLLDATERPLRRSISPQTGEAGEEEWPALSPERPAIHQYDPRLISTIKPSVGESIIEGMRKLNLQAETPTQTQTEEPNEENGTDSAAKGAETKNDPTTITPTISDFPPPPISSANVKPKGYKKPLQKTAPVVRQTKTSAMRQRLSVGSIEDGDRTPQDKEPPGPVRSKSKLRHMATGRGSPYTVATPSHLKDPNGSRVTVSVPSASEEPRSISTESDSSMRAVQVVAVKDAKLSSDGKRKTSIPLPSRLIRHFPNEESEAEIVKIKHRRGSIRDRERQLDSSDADIDTDHDTKKASTTQSSLSNGSSSPRGTALPKRPNGGMFTFTELLATPAPSEHELDSDSDSAEGSVHGFDETGGFKIKKLRGRGSQGATLRISDSAEHLLAPDGGEIGFAVTEENTQQKRSSSTGIGPSLMLKDSLRKSSDLIKSQIKLTRSITERSLARLSRAGSRESKGSDEDALPTDNEQFDSSSVVVKRQASSSPPVEEKTPVGEEPDENKSPEDNQVAKGTPSSQGDWPLKDFKTLASTSKGNSARESTDSSWIPPADWEVRRSLDFPTNPLDFSSPPMQVPQYSPNSAGASRNHFSSSVPPFRKTYQIFAEEDADTPPPTPEKDGPDTRKRRYPPRSSSKQRVPQIALLGNDRSLSPVRETSEHSLAGHVPRKQYGHTPSRIAQPVNARSFTQSIRDIHEGFNAVKSPTPPSNGISSSSKAPKSPGKKAFSTIRGLFHKKSGETRGSIRSKHSRLTVEQISSPLLATPTPLPTMPRHREFVTTSIVGGHADPLQLLPSMPPKATVTLGATSTNSSSPSIDTTTLEPLEIRQATQTALKLLDMARDERPGVRQNQLVELGKATIHVINGARDAEKALEQAKAAVTKAEMHALTSKKAVADVTTLVQQLLV